MSVDRVKNFFVHFMRQNTTTLHSLESLRNHYNVLLRNRLVTNENLPILIESIRSISEIVVWGDQNDSSIFDFFLEKQILSQFLLYAKQSKESSLPTQILQSLHILFENLSNDTALLYIMSNNYVNSVITHDFDLNDDEILSYYIALLKVLSFKLNANTMNLFYDQKYHEFPLYSKSVEYVTNSDSMIRTSARTIILNIFSAAGKSITSYFRIANSRPINYFSVFIAHILSLKSESLSWILSENIHTCLLKWTYLKSICTFRRENTGTDVSRGLATYFLALYLMHVSNDALIQTFMDSLCYMQPVVNQTNGTELCEAIINSSNITDDDKFSNQSRFPSSYLFSAMDCKLGDYLALQTLMLINVIKPSHQVIFQWNHQVVIELCRILLYSCVPGSRVRPVTAIFAAWKLLKIIDDYADSNQAKAILLQCERMSKLYLKRYLQYSANFMETFEGEQEFVQTKINNVSMPIKYNDIMLIMYPSISNVATIPFSHRLPCGHLEHLRRSIRIFHIIQTVCMHTQGDIEKYLLMDPSDKQITNCSCTINSKKYNYFLVEHSTQYILVQPHSSISEHGHVRFCCSVKDIDVSIEKSNPKAISVSMINCRLFKKLHGLNVMKSDSNMNSSFQFDSNEKASLILRRIKRAQQKLLDYKMKRLSDVLETTAETNDQK
ncbi:hypothetical protein GJ496_008653 [Pomphorhynchus laevis]|nr:hypothetical protein GJ496_008653 [Pomphorhynchus laevis]